MTQIKTTTCQPEDVDRDEFKSPSNYYLVNAFGEYIFYHTRSRQNAQEAANAEYGPKYNIRSWKIK